MSSELSLYQGLLLNERHIKLEERIEEGSSVSFQGFHENFQKKVFVKFIPIPWDEGKEIQSEVEALINLKDKSNIVSVFDAFYDVQTESQLVIVTEYLEGNTLEKFCGLKNITLRQAIDIVMEILLGLNEIHRLGIVHRDIKLENIIFDGIKPIILDLGSVKKMNGKVNQDDPIPYLYRSSEIYNSAIYSVKSDMYQVGLILYQLINGAFPLNQNFYAMRLKKNERTSNERHDAQISIQQLVIRNKLLDIVANIPVYCNKLNRLVNKAIKLKYNTVDEFYKELAKIKSNLPDWIKDDFGDEYSCNNWKKGNYRVVVKNEEYDIYKKSIRKSRLIQKVVTASELNNYFQNM